MTTSIDKFERWKKLSETLKDVKAREMILRKEIAADILEGLVPPCKHKMEFGVYNILVENTISHNVDRDVVNSIFGDLSIEDKEALKFNPELKLREYKKLPKDSLLHEAVTTKPSAPTIKIL